MSGRFSRFRFPAAAFVSLLALGAFSAQAASCAGYTACPKLNYANTLKSDPDAQALAAAIAADEQAALNQSAQPGLTTAQLKNLLGELVFFDTALSVRGNQACASCHMPEAGFAGGISVINRAVATFPGSVLPRTGNRKPPSVAYAAFAPVQFYRAGTHDFVGGTFWDARATGAVTGSVAADQAMAPFVNPLEMGLADHACAVLAVAHSNYAQLVTTVWGITALAITWPLDTKSVCSKPGEGGSLTPLDLAANDRVRAEATFTDIALSLAAFETSAVVAPFSSKFDAVQAGQARFTSDEQAGYALFTGKAKCSQCHPATGRQALFTDFTAVNVGVPANRNNPFFRESIDNGKGLVANPLGAAYVDNGLGAILAGSANPQYQALAPKFMGAFQVSTLRNVAAAPRTGFVRAYTHNGYFTDLAQIVHFYNTRDTLPRCKGNTGTVGVTCWPAPEAAKNLNRRQTGNLGLSAQEEAQIVAFLGTLTDGYTAP